jgi:predicted nucleic acid-binding protein
MKTLDGSRLKPLNHPSVSIAASILGTEPASRYQVISADPNDNKFTDCAITANADYVITNDKDFSPLANAGYRPQPITPEEFVLMHLAGRSAP